MRRPGYELAIGLALAVATCVAFGPALENTLVAVDNTHYITKNPRVLAGLHARGVVWAFTTFHACNWHPLTWLSLQADVSLFGAGPLGFHRTNLLLHAATAWVLFASLCAMTGALWRPAFVAAFFALHPLRVESVAWAAERKDVLSGLFWMLTLLAYAWYVRRPSPRRYLLVLSAFALGLLAKPMLVTLPFVLLLLDWWPLRRMTSEPAPATPRPAGGRQLDGPRFAERPPYVRFLRLLGEKVPLFVLAAASCLVTLKAQQDAAQSLHALPFSSRAANAQVAYVAYLGKTVWPVRLAALYPHPGWGPPVWQTIGAALLLGAVTVLAGWLAQAKPYLSVGWLWYVGTLVPVIGLVQVGSQGMADRYTYIPSVGLAVAVVWGAADLAARWHGRQVLAWSAAGLLVVAMVLTWGQAHYWQDDVTLWEHTLEVTGPNNGFAQNALGLALRERGERYEALRHFRDGLRAEPSDGDLNHNTGATLLDAGLRKESVPFLEAGTVLLPKDPSCQHDFGVALFQLGAVARAVPHFRSAIRLNPRYALGHYRLGQALTKQGDFEGAIASLRTAVELEPGQRDFHCALALALSRRGETEAAAGEYRAAAGIDPEWLRNENRFAWFMATHPDRRRRNGVEAVDAAERVCDATGGQEPAYLDTLAAAYAEVGRYADAVATARKALDLASARRDGELAVQLRGRLQRYASGKPIRGLPAATPL